MFVLQVTLFEDAVAVPSTCVKLAVTALLIQINVCALQSLEPENLLSVHGRTRRYKACPVPTGWHQPALQE